MRHRGWTARVLFLALTAMVSATVFAAAAEPGSDGDPLVTLSYLDGTYLSQILDKVDAKIAQRNAQIGVSGGTVILPESGSSAAFGLVTLSQGQTLTGDAGCEIMLRVGSAGCTVSSSPGLIDETTGGTLENGKALVQNHLYMATIQGRGVRAASGTVKLLVRGGYAIG